jgi:protocatechuate 3,4-dioxygenase beta subunit
VKGIDDVRLTRRRSLLGLGGLFAAALGAGAAKATAEGPGGVASGRVKCVLTPEMTEGPYYISGEKLRRDITQSKPGTRLDLALKVVNASTCRPIRGAVVDIWHCDASGVYSGFGAGSSNRTFLRGKQKTDAQGVAHFKTIYPGWYPGRTVHIHVKVYVGGNVAHTGQLFFSDVVTDAAYRRAPYNKRPNRDPRNTGDSIFVNGGKRSMLKLTRRGARYRGTITMGITR